jgi:hypothetical protein
LQEILHTHKKKHIWVLNVGCVVDSSGPCSAQMCRKCVMLTNISVSLDMNKTWFILCVPNSLCCTSQAHFEFIACETRNIHCCCLSYLRSYDLCGATLQIRRLCCKTYSCHVLIFPLFVISWWLWPEYGLGNLGVKKCLECLPV